SAPPESAGDRGKPLRRTIRCSATFPRDAARTGFPTRHNPARGYRAWGSARPIQDHQLFAQAHQGYWANNRGCDGQRRAQFPAHERAWCGAQKRCLDWWAPETVGVMVAAWFILNRLTKSPRIVFLE